MVELPEEKPATVWVVGGDGTLNIAVQAMLLRDWIDVPIRLVPAGTANVLAAEFGVHNAGREVMSVRAMDVGMVNDTCFLMSVGSGVDAKVTELVQTGLKARIGRLAYVVSIFKALTALDRLPEIAITEPGGAQRSGNWLLVTNSSRYAGHMPISSGTLFDGEMEYFLFRIKNIGDFFRAATGLLRRRIEPGKLRRGESLAVSGAEGFQVDGDFVALKKNSAIVTFHPKPISVYSRI